MKTRLSIATGLLAILAAGTFWAFNSAQLYVIRAGIAGSLKYNMLFNSAIWLIPVAASLGVYFGTIEHDEEKTKIVNGKIERHNEQMFFQHWSHTLGTLTLIITGLGLGTLFIPRTIQSVENIGFALNMHFIGILFFFFGACYYVTKGLLTGELKEMLPKAEDLQGAIGHYKAVLFGGEAPKEKKFMAVERVIFPFWILGVSGISISGIVKVAAHIWSLPGALMGAITLLHGVFTIYMTLLVVAHVVAGSLLPVSWPLIRSMVTGYVTEEYVKHHHVKWYEEIQSQMSEENLDNVTNGEKSTKINNYQQQPTYKG